MLLASMVAGLNCIVGCVSPPQVEPGRALLRLVLLDGDRPTSGRVAVRSEDGAGHVSPDGIPLLGDCTDRPEAQTSDGGRAYGTA